MAKILTELQDLSKSSAALRKSQADSVLEEGGEGDAVDEDEDMKRMVLDGDPQVQMMMRDLRAANEKNQAKRAVPLLPSATTPTLIARQFLEEETTRPASPGASDKGRVAFSSQALIAAAPVFHPEGRFRGVWNILMAVLIFWCAVVVPLEIGYDTALRVSLGDGFPAWEGVNYAFDFIFLLDILLNFRTGFVVDGHFVTSQRMIAMQYVRGNFFIDLIGSFPINLILDLALADDGGSDPSSRLNRPLRLLRIFKLNRLLRLSKLSTYLKYVEVLVEFNPSFTRVFSLILLMMGCCHWMGCTWWLVTELEMAYQAYTFNLTLSEERTRMNDWQPHQEVLDANLGAQFASGFFWGAGMVTAMVPYDIMPATEVENYVTALCMFVGLLLNAFVIGSMATALASFDSKKQISRDKLETIGLYLIVNNVAADLRARILEYYEYLYTSSQSMQDLNLFQDLPPSLATRLSITVHRRIVARAPLFNSLSDLALLKVLTVLKPLIYVPGQVVVISGSKLSHINFIKKGRIHILTDLGTDNETCVGELGPTDNFGLDDVPARQLMKQLDSPPDAPTVHGFLQRSRASRFSMHLHQAGTPEWYRTFLTSQTADSSARAATYCDIVSLDVHDLATILAKDYKARMVEHERLQRTSQVQKSLGTVSQIGKARVNFLQRIKGGARKPVGTAKGKDEPAAAAPMSVAAPSVAKGEAAKHAKADGALEQPAASAPSASGASNAAKADALDDEAKKTSAPQSAPRASHSAGGSRDSWLFA